MAKQYILFLSENRRGGVLIEPNPALCKKLKKYRKRDTVLNVGIANSDGYMTYFEMDTSTLNSFSEDYAKQLESQGHKIIKKREIKVIPISHVFKKYGIFDYISIDTEGIDFEILKMIDYQNYAPYVICMETKEFQVERKRDDFQEINEFMKSKGYYIYGYWNQYNICKILGVHGSRTGWHPSVMKKRRKMFKHPIKATDTHPKP